MINIYGFEKEERNAIGANVCEEGGKREKPRWEKPIPSSRRYFSIRRTEN